MNNIWARTVCIGALTVSSMASNAAIIGDDYKDQCDYKFNYTVKAAPGSLTVLDEGVLLYRIDDQGVLYIDGKAVDQNRLQRRNNKRFKQNIEELPIEIMDLAVDAMEIAFVSIGATLDMFGIRNEEFEVDLKAAIESGVSALEKRLKANESSWTMGPNEFNLIGNEEFGPEFEQRVEAIVEKYSGDIAMGALKAVFTDAQSIEERSHEIEALVEARAQEIEASASELCSGFAEIVDQEKILRESQPDLTSMPLLEKE